MARYRYFDVNVGVRVVFVHSSLLFGAIGRATLVSDPGAVVEFSDPGVVQGIRTLGPRLGDALSMHYLDSGRAINGRIADIYFAADRCTVEVDFAALAPISELRHLLVTAPQTTRYILNADTDDSPTADIVGRRIYYFLELLEGARSLSNLVSVESSGSYTEPPILRQLRVESPIQLVVDVGPWVTAIIGTLAITGGVLAAAKGVTSIRGQWHEGTGKKLDNQDRLELRRRREAIEAAEAASSDDVVSLLREAAPESELPRTDIENAVVRDLLPHVHHLSSIGVVEIRIEVIDAPKLNDASDGPAELTS